MRIATIIRVTTTVDFLGKTLEKGFSFVKLREKLKIALVASFIILLVIDVLDVLSTFLGFKIGFVEANSFPQWLITIFGPMLGLITGKAISLARDRLCNLVCD